MTQDLLCLPKRFQFMLFDEGNLLIMTDNQVEVLMNKIYSTDQPE